MATCGEPRAARRRLNWAVFQPRGAGQIRAQVAVCTGPGAGHEGLSKPRGARASSSVRASLRDAEGGRVRRARRSIPQIRCASGRWWAIWWGGPCESKPALERRLVGRERLRPAAPAHSCRVLGPLDEQRPAGAPRRGLMLGRAWSRAGGSGAGAGLAWQSRRVTDPVNVQAVETAGASQGRPVSRGATGLHGVARKE